MIDLNKEAKKYTKCKSPHKVFQEAHIEDFIAGANSNFVKQQILLAQIDVLNKIKEAEIYDKIRYIESYQVDYKIMKVQQELKQLQDEK